MKKTIIDIKNVCKSYNVANKKINVLKDINLNINEGELTVISGYSGSGKSTLLNAISTFIEVDSGTILVNGKDITKYNEFEKNNYRKNSISVIFQNYNLLEDLTVYENILLGSKIGRNKCNINKLLSLIDLVDEKDKYPNELSGGEAQRVSIARSLAKGGDIYLCDEPTGALDIDNGKIILKLLRKLVDEEHKTVVIITHNDLVRLAADHIIILKDGKVVEDKYNDSPIDIDKVEW